MKGLDIVGFALIALSVLLVLAFGISQSSGLAGVGSGTGYTVKDLAPMLPGVLGFLLVIVARFVK